MSFVEIQEAKEVIRAFQLIKKRHFSFLKCLFFVLLGLFGFSQPITAKELCLSPEQQLANVNDWGVVAKVIDGDTLHLKDGRKIRLIGIDTPEIGRRGEASQPYGRKAYEVLVKLLKNHKKIGLSYDKDKTDRYKRELAYITLADGQSVEQKLLLQGLAHSIIFPPNDKHIMCYRHLENIARKAKSGLWKLPENQWIQARHLSSKANGLRYITGKVSGYSESKKSVYLKLTSKLSIRIAKKDKRYFSAVHFKGLQGKSVRVRGWLSRSKGRQSIHIRTAYDLQIVSL